MGELIKIVVGLGIIVFVLSIINYPTWKAIDYSNKLIDEGKTGQAVLWNIVYMIAAFAFFIWLITQFG